MRLELGEVIKPGNTKLGTGGIQKELKATGKSEIGQEENSRRKTSEPRTKRDKYQL